MSGTLRHTVIHRRRHKSAKRLKLRSQLARASGAEKQALEAKILKTYSLLTAKTQATRRA